MKYLKRIISATLLTAIIPTLNSKAKTTQEGSIQKTRELSEYIIQISIPMSKKDAKTIIKASNMQSLQNFDIANKCLNEVKKLIPTAGYQLYAIYYNQNSLIIQYVFLSTAKIIGLKTDEKLKIILEKHLKLWIASVKTKTHVIEITLPMPESKAQKIIIANDRLHIIDPNLFQQLILKPFNSIYTRIQKINPIKHCYSTFYYDNQSLILHSLITKSEAITPQQEAKIKPILTEFANICINNIKSNTKIIEGSVPMTQDIQKTIDASNKISEAKFFPKVEPLLIEVRRKINKILKNTPLTFHLTQDSNNFILQAILITKKTLTPQQEAQIKKILTEYIKQWLATVKSLTK